jgi:hypothetical protein
MGYAKYIGRVGALAVTLGVGAAMATTPAVVYAQPSDTSSTSDSSPSSTSSTEGAEGTDSPASESESASDPAEDSTDEADDPVDEGTDEDTDENTEEGDEESPPADSAVEDDATVEDSAADRKASGVDSRRAASSEDLAGDVDKSATSVEPSQADRKESRLHTTAEVVDNPVDDLSADALTTSATTFTTAATTSSTPATTSVAVAPQPPPTLVSVVTGIVSEWVAAVIRPFMSLGTGSPLQAPLLWGALAAVRNEMERTLFRRTPAASQYTVTQIDPTPNSVLADPTPNVLVIGVDGTNLSRILADDANDNFFALMDDGTTAASSIVGHTTISNPSWSAILTGVWSERTGVINNVFTPWTYDRWPTVFNQLEAYNPDIETTTIANWDVINAISGAGSTPVDTNIYIPQFEGDTDWSETDDAVGAATVEAIEDTPIGVPTFIFSYFVGVDENGHMHGGASDQYADAIVNVDENLGDILTAVRLWEEAHPNEGEWTIIVVTDHGHQPQQGFGHGFQTPDETATFVIASGPDFENGWVNPDYEIVDTTPTVLDLFGAPTPAYFDGVSLTELGPGEQPADLHRALRDMIATNSSPDIVTDVALSLRTIFATVPYYVWMLNNDGTLPIPLLGDVLYVVTNIPAQIVARLTGVTGASIFPLFPPGPPSWPGQDEEVAPDTTVLACGAGGESASAACDAASVA